jgi:hypothetical protein
MAACRSSIENIREMNLTPKNLDVFLAKNASNQPLLKTR